MSKNCSRTWQNLTLSPFVSRKTRTSKLSLQLDHGTHFNRSRQPLSSYLIFYYCSQRISNSMQSSNEIEAHWSKDCNQDKTMWHTGTTQAKTQSSREYDKFCRWLYRGGGKVFIYTNSAFAKESIIWLTGTFRRHCNVLPVIGFNNANYDINLIKWYLLPIPVNERDIEPTVVKKANQFYSFKFIDIQLLDIMNFLGGANSLDSFLKAYKTKETKGFFPYQRFDCPEKLNKKEPPPYF